MQQKVASKSGTEKTSEVGLHLSNPPCHNPTKNVNNYGLSHGEKGVTNSPGSDTPGDHVKFYAHTAEGENGEALPEYFQSFFENQNSASAQKLVPFAGMGY